MNQHLLIVSLVGLIVGGAASWVSADSPAEKLWQALDKFAVDPNMGSSGSSYEDYEAAYTDIKENFSLKDLEERRIKSASFRLFEDFVLTPMDRWRLKGGELLFKTHYVKRMEDAYKRFWPAYVNGMPVTPTGAMWPTKKLYYFVLAAVGFNKTPEYLTLPVWREAEREYHALVLKGAEMVKWDDIYNQLYDYERILNLTNYNIVKVMMEDYAARMNKCRTDADMQPILKEYREIFSPK